MRHSDNYLITDDGARIYAQRWLPDGRPRAVILVVQGLGEHSGRYGNYVEYFLPRGYALYGFDTRGHGRSSGARGHIRRFDQYVADIDRMSTAARSDWPGISLFVLGHSLGSLMGLSYARQYPDRLAGLITSGTALQDALALPAWRRQLAGLLSRLAPSVKMNNGVPLSGLSHDPAVAAVFRADPLTHLWATPRLAEEVRTVREQIRRCAGKWQVPTLMLHGGADPICPAEGARRFAGQTPQGLVEYHEYPGLYHEIHNEPEREQAFWDMEKWLQNPRFKIPLWKLGHILS